VAVSVTTKKWLKSTGGGSGEGSDDDAAARSNEDEHATTNTRSGADLMANLDSLGGGADCSAGDGARARPPRVRL
jgi:hypothetical protein